MMDRYQTTFIRTLAFAALFAACMALPYGWSLLAAGLLGVCAKWIVEAK